MRLVRPQHNECDSAREAISLAFDDALSELEQLRLQAHLDHCAECRSFQARLGDFTAVLRSAEPAQPEFAVVLPRRRPRSARVIEAGAVVAAMGIVATTLLLNVVGQRPLIGTSSQGRSTAASATVERVFSHDAQPVSIPPKHLHAV